MPKGKHVIVDCRGVARDICLADERLMNVMAEGARAAGMHVINTIRYKFGMDSAPGCTAIVMLDESHCSAHTYADTGLCAFDFFTCGDHDPALIWEHVRDTFGLSDFTVTIVDRFTT